MIASDIALWAGVHNCVIGDKSGRWLRPGVEVELQLRNNSGHCAVTYNLILEYLQRKFRLPCNCIANQFVKLTDTIISYARLSSFKFVQLI